jgi:branched-chain amino acid transport system substrate-binding protein
MTDTTDPGPSRRGFLAGAAAVGVAAGTGLLPARFAIGGEAPVKVGILLPYSGTYASLGQAITDGMKLRIEQAGGTLGGRPVEYIAIDSEASPPRAPQHTKKLVIKDQVDFLVGPVHSGVALAMAKVVSGRDKPIMIIPNAGANALTRELCAPNIFRSSFSNWQTCYPCGRVMADDGHKTVVTMTWKYAAGDEIMDAGTELFKEYGGTVIKDIRVPFPDVEFQAHLSEIAALKPDAVLAFFSGGGAVKFVKDYAAAGLKDSIPLYGPGFLTEGLTEAQGAAAEGIKSTLHYARTLDTPANRMFLEAYQKAHGRDADVFAVQGYDTGSLLLQAISATGGETGNGAGVTMIEALSSAEVPDSPRGPWRMSRAHNPVMDVYLRQVEGGVNRILGVASKDLADPATGCKMG